MNCEPQFFLKIAAVLFSWTFLCLEELFVLKGNWEFTFSRLIKAYFVSFKTVAFLIVTNVG